MFELSIPLIVKPLKSFILGRAIFTSLSINSYILLVLKVTFTPALASANVPADGDGYSIGPKIVITGDGHGANARATNTASGVIGDIVMVSGGNNYGNAVATIVTNAGSSGAITPIIGPRGGHGDDAIEELDKVRNAEGKNLKKDLETRLKNVETYVSQIESKSSKQRGQDFKRYKNRISELLEDVSLDEQRLLQEVAIIAEKKDISEEIVRLKSHIKLYNTYFDDTEYAGRKMNFMLQEMGREVNTIGSKTDQIEVSHLVVSLKDELEKMREQVQNIL